LRRLTYLAPGLPLDLFEQVALHFATIPVDGGLSRSERTRTAFTAGLGTSIART